MLNHHEQKSFETREPKKITKWIYKCNAWPLFFKLLFLELNGKKKKSIGFSNSFFSPLHLIISFYDLLFLWIENVSFTFDAIHCPRIERKWYDLFRWACPFASIVQLLNQTHQNNEKCIDLLALLFSSISCSFHKIIS